jgi:hypothetical protein
MTKSRALGITLAIAALATIGGCSSSDPTSPTTGNVRVLLTDAPMDLSTVSAVNVTLQEMILVGNGNGNSEEPLEMRMHGVVTGEDLTLNLLDFQNGRTVVIADLEAPEGTYRKLRMLVAEAELVIDDDGDPETEEVSMPIKVPSSKVDIPVSFTVTGGETTEVTLDFDAALSVQVNETPDPEQYILRPVITPTKVSSE